mmetsp:Transcript_22010/g.74623  ORF Transcript_22010/g.74623 Transcript_22010/m.74623 type:complete len:351 (+) Transcript_22010:510-1562(+)
MVQTAPQSPKFCTVQVASLSSPRDKVPRSSFFSVKAHLASSSRPTTLSSRSLPPPTCARTTPAFFRFGLGVHVTLTVVLDAGATTPCSGTTAKGGWAVQKKSTAQLPGLETTISWSCAASNEVFSKAISSELEARVSSTGTTSASTWSFIMWRSLTAYCKTALKSPTRSLSKIKSNPATSSPPGTTCAMGVDPASSAGKEAADSATKATWGRPLRNAKFLTTREPTQTRPKSSCIAEGTTLASSAALSRAAQWRISACVDGLPLNFANTRRSASNAAVPETRDPPPLAPATMYRGSNEASGSGGSGGSSMPCKARSTPFGSARFQPAVKCRCASTTFNCAASRVRRDRRR